jgi:hypothetical protein
VESRIIVPPGELDNLQRAARNPPISHPAASAEPVQTRQCLCDWELRMKKLPRTILTLQKRTDTLRNLLRRSAGEQRLLDAARRMREAKIQVLRATIGELSPALFTLRRHKRIEELCAEIGVLRATAPHDILNEFRGTLAMSLDD